ncbi:MAG TPA: hypothetical protein VE986_11045, partial [Hyphomicrobiales bacterium]|nr:hypothetical protein [Hyphomicrobiales bacterium]
YVKNRRLNLNGKRAGIAMHRYEMNRVIPPRGLNSSATAYPNGTANTNGDPQNSMAYGTPNAGGYPAGFQPQQ